MNPHSFPHGVAAYRHGMINSVQRWFLLVLIVASCATGTSAQDPGAQQSGVQTVTLDNGITMLLMRRPTMAGQVACGWLLRGGASLDLADQAGMCHLVMSVMHEVGFMTTPGPGEPTGNPFPPLNDLQRRAVLLHDLAFWETQYPRWRGGEIGDPFSPANQTPELSSIREAISSLFAPADDAASGDAASPLSTIFHFGVTHDFGIAFAQVASVNLEDWARRETARLSRWPDPRTFGEIQSDLLTRRLELGPRSPVLQATQDLDAALWPDHPYGRRAISSIALIDDATYEQAQQFYRQHVRPENLVVLIVGDFNPVGASVMLRRHFETIESAGASPEAAEAPPTAGPVTARLLEREWSAPTRVYEVFRGPAVDHPDHAAVVLLARVLRYRLHQKLVTAPTVDGEDGPVAENAQDDEEHEAMASWVAAGADGRGLAGVFSLSAESFQLDPTDGLPGKSALSKDALRAHLEDEIDRLKQSPVAPEELEAIRTKVLADLLSPMADHVSLMLTLGVYEAMGDWRRFNQLYSELASVSAIDLQAAARTYLVPQRRVVGQFEARAFDLDADAELAQLAEDQRQAAATLLNRIIDTGTRETWAQTVQTLQNDLPSAEPVQQVLMRFLIRRLRAKLET